MEENEIREVLSEYADANSIFDLANLLKDELVAALEDTPAENDSQRHRLNMTLRDIEEELDWIENEKLAEFDPEQD